MRIHQITHLFHPDELAGAALYTDLARYLRDRGHDVRVTSTFSYYPALQYNPEDRELCTRDESFEGIPVRRVGMYLPRKHRGWRRLLPEISYAWRLARLARFPDWVPDVVITACPMLAQCLAQRFLYRNERIPRLIVVQDFMVDAALELGILKIPGLGPVLRTVEAWALRSASTLATISPAMSEKLRPLGRKTVVIQNWIHESLRIRAAEATHGTVRDTGRLFYSGNLGIKQGLPQFLESFAVAAPNHWELDIRGGGAEAARVQATVADMHNVRIGALQEEGIYLRSLARATACLITQREGVGANFLPSKLLPALATGTPVLAICEPDAPLGREVIEGGFGAVVRPGDRPGLNAVLSGCLSSPETLNELGVRASERAELYSRERSCGRYEQLLYQLARGC